MLVLGSFQGQVACTLILVVKGVCGTWALTGKTLRISSAHLFDGHTCL